jgi:hypothetical protein
LLSTEDGDRNDTMIEESKMPIIAIPRNVPPRIIEKDRERLTDDGRSFPANSINTK